MIKDKVGDEQKCRVCGCVQAKRITLSRFSDGGWKASDGVRCAIARESRERAVGLLFLQNQGQV